MSNRTNHVGRLNNEGNRQLLTLSFSITKVGHLMSKVGDVMS